MKAHGWRKIASATWGRPNDPQIYGDLGVDATRLLAFIEEARRVTGVHVTVTHAVGKAVAQGLAAHPHLARSADDGSASIDVFFVVSAAEGEEVSGVNVRGADRKSLVDIAAALDQRAKPVRERAGGELGMSKRALALTPIWLLRPALRFASWLTGEKNVTTSAGSACPSGRSGPRWVSSVGMFGPLHTRREGSIGIPFPDMLAAVCAPGKTEELPAGEEGEICISGPAVMLGYLDNPDATAEALIRHSVGPA